MRLVLIALCLLPAAALASEKKKVDLKPNSAKAVKKAEDPGSATKLLYEDPKKLKSETAQNNGGIAISSTCTDHQGMVHTQGEKSFDACLRTLDKTAPAKSPSDKNAPSMGITIGK